MAYVALCIVKHFAHNSTNIMPRSISLPKKYDLLIRTNISSFYLSRIKETRLVTCTLSYPPPNPTHPPSVCLFFF